MVTTFINIATKVKVKISRYRPGQAWSFQEVEVSGFQDNQRMKVVNLSALSTGRLYPQEIFLVLISVRGWINPRAIVRPEGLCQWNMPITLWEIKPTTFRLVARCLNRLCHLVPPPGAQNSRKNNKGIWHWWLNWCQACKFPGVPSVRPPGSRASSLATQPI